MLIKITVRILTKLFSKEKLRSIIQSLARIKGISLWEDVLSSRGFLNYQNLSVSGEENLIGKILRNKFRDENKKLILFDVGANIGKYSKLLHTYIPEGKIYAFEPNPYSFEKLRINLQSIPSTQIELWPIGLSSSNTTLKLTTDANNLGSSHASFHSNIFEELRKPEKQKQVQTNVLKLDNFCEENRINFIDLLKIDTEGHELDVLKGAKNMLARGKIEVIQFEFGDCNIYSRVFLKDFYEILQGFSFFRLTADHLIPLGDYDTSNEIFIFQNIVAIKN